MTDLLELAARCEAAEGPDRELDGLIEVARDPMREIILGSEPGPFPQTAIRGPVKDLLLAGADLADYVGAPPFTASIDAAMTLVPEGWDRGTIMQRGRASAYVNNGQSHFVGVASRQNPESLWFECKGATEALALCAAALRARAHDGQRGPHD